MDGVRSLAEEVDWTDGVKGDGVVDDPDAVGLGDGEDVEEPLVGGEGDLANNELLTILVNVGVKPSPFTVVDIIEVRIPVAKKS